jgi:hypothetical protein
MWERQKMRCPPTGTGGAPATGGQANAAGGAEAKKEGGAESGGQATSTGADGSVEGGSTDARATVPLPDGSRELDGIVNLVDADAAAQLESFLLDLKLQFLTLRHGLTRGKVCRRRN